MSEVASFLRATSVAPIFVARDLDAALSRARHRARAETEAEIATETETEIETEIETETETDAEIGNRARDRCRRRRRAGDRRQPSCRVRAVLSEPRERAASRARRARGVTHHIHYPLTAHLTEEAVGARS